MQLADWVDDAALAAWVHDATERVVATVGDFTADDHRWIGPYLPIVNPPVWELAHVAWFAEAFVLRRVHGRSPLLDAVDERYDSSDVPHRTRWTLAHLEPAMAVDYLRRVGEAMAEVVIDDRGLDSTRDFVAYSVMHHDAHYEALTYTRQTLDWGANHALADGPAPSAATVAGEPVRGDRPVSGGRYVLGGARSQPFLMDNEKWGHAVDVERFDLAVTPVTVAEYATFVDEGGYDDHRLWSPDGLAWLQAESITGPAYWRRGPDGWERRTVDRWHPIGEVADHPMIHVNWWEADAYCTWAGRRLPTEAEWEVAATTGPDGARRPWFPWGDRDPRPAEAALDGASRGTVPVGAHPAGDGPWGHRQLIGNVWEWTATTFEPYPNFEVDAYGDNSVPWFGSRKVLRGGSWATRNRYVRATFRNYFTPDRRDVFAGFRTCARPA
ncbi:MAG: selenoneine synthase SenA [Actinomycetota bacterium]